MLWSEAKDKYIDKTMYRDTVPADKKKNGFMSSDFPRRDEFSNTIRTLQLREILKVRSSITEQGVVPGDHGKLVIGTPKYCKARLCWQH